MLNSICVPRATRYAYWDYYTSYAMRKYRPRMVTDTRLSKIKKQIIDDDDFWLDVILRHNAQDLSPIEFQAVDFKQFEHSIGNFYGMIMEIIALKT